MDRNGNDTAAEITPCDAGLSLEEIRAIKADAAHDAAAHLAAQIIEGRPQQGGAN